MWVRFTKDFDFYPAARKGNTVVAYKAGMEQNVTRECADLAETAGAITALKRAKRADPDGKG